MVVQVDLQRIQIFQHWGLTKMDLKQEYYDGLNDGGKYLCDKCDKVKLSEHEFCFFIKGQFHYCEPCWNYIHLKKGTCDSCGDYHTNRSESRELIIKCNCGGMIRMKVNDQ